MSAAEREAWAAWSRGERRCPYCVGLDWRDFEAVCDCFRFEREAAAAVRVGGDAEAET